MRILLLIILLTSCCISFAQWEIYPCGKIEGAPFYRILDSTSVDDNYPFQEKYPKWRAIKIDNDLASEVIQIATNCIRSKFAEEYMINKSLDYYVWQLLPIVSNQDTVVICNLKFSTNPEKEQIPEYLIDVQTSSLEAYLYMEIQLNPIICRTMLYGGVRGLDVYSDKFIPFPFYGGELWCYLYLTCDDTTRISGKIDSVRLDIFKNGLFTEKLFMEHRLEYTFSMHYCNEYTLVFNKEGFHEKILYISTNVPFNIQDRYGAELNIIMEKKSSDTKSLSQRANLFFDFGTNNFVLRKW